MPTQAWKLHCKLEASLSRLTAVLVERHKPSSGCNSAHLSTFSQMRHRRCWWQLQLKLARRLKQSKISLDQTVYRIDLIQQSHYAYSQHQECAHVALILLKLVPHLKKRIYLFYNYEEKNTEAFNPINILLTSGTSYILFWFEQPYGLML